MFSLLKVLMFVGVFFATSCKTRSNDSSVMAKDKGMTKAETELVELAQKGKITLFELFETKGAASVLFKPDEGVKVVGKVTHESGKGLNKWDCSDLHVRVFNEKYVGYEWHCYNTSKDVANTDDAKEKKNLTELKNDGHRFVDDSSKPIFISYDEKPEANKNGQRNGEFKAWFDKNGLQFNSYFKIIYNGGDVTEKMWQTLSVPMNSEQNEITGFLFTEKRERSSARLNNSDGFSLDVDARLKVVEVRLRK